MAINQVPCPNCHRNLPRALLEGAELEVIGPNGFRRTYRGLPDDVRAEWAVDHESSDPRLQHALVPDADELERLLDRLAAEAAATRPFIVVFVSSAGARLGVGLGAPAGSVLFSRSPTIRPTT